MITPQVPAFFFGSLDANHDVYVVGFPFLPPHVNLLFTKYHKGF